MSQRDMLEIWRILVNGVATTAIEAADTLTEAIARRRPPASPAADQPANGDRPGIATTPPAPETSAPARDAQE